MRKIKLKESIFLISIVFWLCRNKDICDFLLDTLYLLDSDIRRDIFIGMTGLFVAIVIFIAEFISNQQYELNKRLLLHKTEIIKNIKFIIFVFAFMLYCSLFPSEIVEQSPWIYKSIYMILQIILNSLIVIFMYKTLKVFIVTIKINTDNDFFNEELDKYIFKKADEIFLSNKKYSAEQKKKREKINEYIMINKIFSFKSNGLIFDDNYKAITPLKAGYIEDIDISMIKSIIKEYEKEIRNGKIENDLLNEEPILIFTKTVGDKVERNFALAYCKEKYYSIFKDINKAIKYDEEYITTLSILKVTNDDLLNMSKSGIKDYDENNRIFNYLDYLYKNDNKDIKDDLFSRIEEICRMIANNDIDTNYRFSRFLTRLLNLSYNYDNYEDYNLINNCITHLYLKLISQEVDVDKVAYNYANSVFIGRFIRSKRNNDSRYYDNLMSNMYTIICDLIKRDSYKAVYVLFDNIYFENSNYWDELTKYEIIKFQFACGIVYCLKLKLEKIKEVNLSDEDKNYIKLIINVIKNRFNGFHDSWKLIINFKKYFNYKTCIQSKYNNLDFYFFRNELKNHWSGYGVNERIILKDILYLFNVYYGVIDEKDSEYIDKEDKHYYSDLLTLVSDNQSSIFKQIIDYRYNVEAVSNVINSAIRIAEEKEEKYIISTELDIRKLEIFKEKIIEVASRKEGLLDYLERHNKINQFNEKLKVVLGISQLIPRDLFFAEDFGLEDIAENFGLSIPKGIEEEYIKKIESFCEIQNVDLKKLLENLINPEKYLLLLEHELYFQMTIRNKEKKYLQINNKKLDILEVSSLSGAILIEKKYLPIIEYCEFDNDYDKSKIENNIYYNMMDCSKNEKLRTELAEKSEWLKEKGDEIAIDKFLKQQCFLRVYVAFKVVNVEKAKGIKVNIEEL